MPSFVLEMYVPVSQAEQVADVASRLRAAAAELRREGLEVAYLRSIFVPEDETCFHLFEGASGQVVQEVSRRASLGGGWVKGSVATSGRRGR